MKQNKKLILLPLSTLLLCNAAIIGFAAESHEIETVGDVTFTAGSGETEVVPPVPEPEVEIPPVGPPEEMGPLTISYAPTLSFGTQTISNANKEYNLVAEMQQVAGTTGAENRVPYVSFVQVADTRGTNAGWKLSVTLGKFLSNTVNSELLGAAIEFVAPELVFSGNNQTIAPEVHENQLMLHAGGSKEMLLNAAEGKGAGRSSVVWGDQDDLDDQFENDVEVVENNGIKLHVPGNTAKDATTYSARLVWELEATIDEEGEIIPEG
jgi:hypothetical protein